jgi:hypothetical protein
MVFNYGPTQNIELRNGEDVKQSVLEETWMAGVPEVHEEDGVGIYSRRLVLAPVVEIAMLMATTKRGVAEVREPRVVMETQVNNGVHTMVVLANKVLAKKARANKVIANKARANKVQVNKIVANKEVEANGEFVANKPVEANMVVVNQDLEAIVLVYRVACRDTYEDLFRMRLSPF